MQATKQLHPVIARSIAWFNPQRDPDYGAQIQRDCAAEADRRDTEAKAYDAALGDLKAAFLRAAMAGDMNATADFAPRVNDYSLSRARKVLPKRMQTVGEVMAESVDYDGGPSMGDMFVFLVAVARGDDMRTEAEHMLRGMAAKWAEMNVDEVMA